MTLTKEISSLLKGEDQLILYGQKKYDKEVNAASITLRKMKDRVAFEIVALMKNVHDEAAKEMVKLFAKELGQLTDGLLTKRNK